MGMELTDEVRKAIPVAMQSVKELINSLQT